MTDKEQIMIDDVDVSECVHYEDLSCTAFRDSCGYPLDCKDFFSCNYKQLTRKTQECEQKDKELLSNEKIINKLMKEVDELKQECEEYKKRAVCFKDVNKQLGYKYLTIKQECESLKQEIEILQNNFDTATRDCNDEIEILKQECEEQKEKYEALKLENQEGYEIVAELKQECEELKQRLQCNCFDPKSNNNRCISYNRIAEDYERDLKRLENKIAECEELKEQLIQKDEINTFFNTPIEGWSSNPCDICESKNNYEQLKQECEELKEKYEALKLENQEGYEIVAELKQECEELKRKVELMMDCPDCKVDEYKKALEEIENNINKYFEEAFYKNCRYAKECTSACGLATNRVFNKILDIINKAKGE